MLDAQNTNRNRRATSVGAFDVYVAIFRARTREIPSGGHYSSKILSQDRSREYSKSMEYLEVNRLILKFWQSFYILYQICTTWNKCLWIGHARIAFIHRKVLKDETKSGRLIDLSDNKSQLYISGTRIDLSSIQLKPLIKLALCRWCSVLRIFFEGLWELFLVRTLFELYI